MGRHRTAQEERELGARARELRENGWSRERIEAEVHVGRLVLSELLDGTQAPDALRRPRARDETRALARRLRGEGWTYDQIARELGVAKSTCSLWLRDLPRPEPLPRTLPVDATTAPVPGSAPERRARARDLRGDGALLREIAHELGVTTSTVSGWCAGIPAPRRTGHGGDLEHVRAMAGARWAPERAARDARRADIHAGAAAELGVVTSRDLLVALAVSYWCEGAKAKPWNPKEAVHWMNSDPGLVTLFLAGLAEAGLGREQMTFRLSIHERADGSEARAWWAAHVGVHPDSFLRSTLKRHNPRTARHASGDSYRGCLTVRVRLGRELYQRLDGLVQALVGACEAAPREQFG